MKSVAEQEIIKEQLDETEIQLFSQFRRFKMFVQRLGKELLFIFIISCTTYATLINMQVIPIQSFKSLYPVIPMYDIVIHI